MILRFNKIEGVGKFRSVLTIGGLSFSDINLIYGGNTKGKSTLTAIFKSLQSGDKTIIKGRQSFGSNTQEIVLHTGDGEIKFSSQKWSNGFPRLVIFDDDFISKNIHLGGEVAYDNHKSLNTVIIGEEGQKIADDIEKLQNEVTEITTKKKNHGNIYTNRFPNAELTLTKFKNLKKIIDVDSEIEKVKIRINDVQNQDKIRTTCDQVDKYFKDAAYNLDFTATSQPFEINQKIISDHINKTWSDANGSINFIQTGLALLKSDAKDCVFCGQELNKSSLDLIQEFNKLFSEQYLQLQASIAQEISIFKDWNIELSITRIKTVSGNVGIRIDFDTNLSQLKTDFEKELDKKLQDLSYSVDFSSFKRLQLGFLNAHSSYSKLKNERLKEITESFESLKEQLQMLEFAKIRHGENWDEYFEKHKELDIAFDKKKNEREAKRAELEEYGIKIYEKHHKTINLLLSNLQADFRLKDFKPLKKIKGKDERIFSLTFFTKHDVILEGDNTTIPNFRNTLSESDKRLLAFTFFISSLINDKDLGEKIVVFDDPFSSFDSERRRATITEILTLSNTNEVNQDRNKPKQIFILTHELDFYKWCLLKFPTCISVEIINDGMTDGVKKSSLSRINKDLFLEQESIKDLKAISSIVNDGEDITDLEGWFSKCRKILEDTYTKKYLPHLTDDILARKGVRTFTETLKLKKVNGFDDTVKFQKLMNLCDDLNIELHNNGFTNDKENGVAVLRDFISSMELV
ncbi:hypothetical protein OC25_17635 [Pedobacter kyungheensis]|uniref:Protein CR006 P-loop domain-containing protein n=1 Tax=Pedobacter kyungheensis TaxID=1069985 RepID=A0A0C1D5F9_9SPHI|nr:AAA family ATPase [Pedobacter kyungheensis]KIA92256.1 hypothetical protein OC25_17635 [Pedobacter kyungheensis]